MGARIFTDLVRPNVRSRLAEGHEVPSGARLEMMTQDTRRIAVTLQLESDIMRRSNAVGGGSLRHKPSADSSTGWFLYNSVASLMVLNGRVIRDKIILWMRKLGIHPAILLTFASLGVVVLMFGGLAYNRHVAAEEAEQKQKTLEELQKTSS